MELSSLIKPYQIEIEKALKNEILILGPKNSLRNACEYALLNGGKRFRPALVLMVSEALGSRFNSMPAALAVEFFHTASLIADDLPCMDNDDLRREKPSLHKAFDETHALLATYALIAAGYERIHSNSLLLKNQGLSNADAICSLALENATHNTGILGATGGQFLDIYPPNLNEENLRDVIHKKTVTLFEISFVFGWLFGGGNPENLFQVKKVASHFGMAFQIIDDFMDIHQDKENKRVINYPLAFGELKAIQVLEEELNQLKVLLKNLKLDSPALTSLESFLRNSLEAFFQKTF